MNAERKTLADLFAHMEQDGVEMAIRSPCPRCWRASPEYIAACTHCGGENYRPITEDDIWRLLGEMRGRVTAGVTESDVLDAAKKAGVF